MNIEVIQEALHSLPAHGQIPIAFEVRSVLELTVADRGLGGFVLSERALASPYVKDYDSLGDRPGDWAQRFDITSWTLHSAWHDGRRAGGVVTAFGTDGLDMLERRRDLAVIWDLRVVPGSRGCGLGTALFAAAETWAKAQGCRPLYRFAYPLLPEDIQLLWYKDICQWEIEAHPRIHPIQMRPREVPSVGQQP